MANQQLLFKQLEEGAKQIALKEDFSSIDWVAKVIETIESMTGVDLTVLQDIVNTIQTALDGIGVDITSLQDLIATIQGILGSITDVSDAIQEAVDNFIHDFLLLLDGWTSGIFNLDELAAVINDTRATAESKPNLEDIPLAQPISTAIGVDEDATFDRSQLSFGAAALTSAETGPGFHIHPLQAVPDYDPIGGGADIMEIAFIRCSRKRQYTMVGFGTGDSLTISGIEAAYIGVYSMDPSTGDITLLTPTLAATDIKASVTTANKEFRFATGVTIDANQGDTFAVALLQKTGAFQTCASILCTTSTQIANPSGQFPTKPYGFNVRTSSGSNLPSTLAHSAIDFSVSTKLPFYVLG